MVERMKELSARVSARGPKFPHALLITSAFGQTGRSTFPNGPSLARSEGLPGDWYRPAPAMQIERDMQLGLSGNHPIVSPIVPTGNWISTSGFSKSCSPSRSSDSAGAG